LSRRYHTSVQSLQWGRGVVFRAKKYSLPLQNQSHIDIKERGRSEEKKKRGVGEKRKRRVEERRGLDKTSRREEKRGGGEERTRQDD